MTCATMVGPDPRSTAAALIQHANAAFGGTQSQGAYSPKDATDLLELAVNRSIVGNTLYDPRSSDPVPAIEKLSSILSLLPTQTKRDEEMESFQQFSTPPHLAYLVAWTANLSPKDVVLEPSAGVGGIAVFALNAGSTVYVNELSERRSRLLSILPFKERFAENAEQLNNVLPAYVKPTVLLLNPPFSATAGRTGHHRVRNIGCRHVDQALLRLQSGGRLVAILGDGNGTPEWWYELGKKYTVRASIGIPGSEYAKMGTRFPVRLIVVDKVPPGNVATVIEDADSVLGAVELLRPVRELRNEASDVATVAVSASASDAEVNRIQPVATNINHSTEPAIQQQESRHSSNDVSRTDADLCDREPPETAHISAITPVSSAPMSDAVFEAYRPQRLHVEGAQPHPTPLVQSAAMASVLPPVPTYAPAIPHELIESGALSEAQIEPIVYAGQANRQFLPEQEIEHPLTREKRMVKLRKGFFDGDGAGAGKGRTICGFIMDHFARGGRRAIWVSKSTSLLNDAIRDWTDLGGREDEITALGQIKVHLPIPRLPGRQILFLTYNCLRSGSKPRIDPMGKKVRMPDLPDKGAGYKKHWEEYIARGFIRLANKPSQYSFEYARHHKIRGGEYDGVSLGSACYQINKQFDEDEPDISAVRKAIGLQTESEQPKDDGEKSRLRQVIEWAGESFDGPICFDEAHAMKSAISV